MAKVQKTSVIDHEESGRGEPKAGNKSRPAKQKKSASQSEVLEPDLPVPDGDEEEKDGAELEEAEETDPEILLDDEELGSDLHDEATISSLPIVSQTRLPAPSLDALHLYLREIGRFPMLKPDEEFELARRVRENGDNEAAFRLISSHLRLVVKIAMDFQRRWMQNVLDLIQEGNVGLMRAVNKFDPDKDIKFSYYAAFWIRAYILKFIMDNWRMVKIGTTQAQRKLFYNLNKERQRLLTQGFDPDAATLADRLGVKSEQIVEMQQRLDSTDVSLDAPLGDESGASSRVEHLPALEPGIEESMAVNEIAGMVQDQLRDILPSLSEKEAYILEHRLLTDDPVTLREIGERYDITRERVRQLEVRLLQKLRSHMAKHIEDFSEDWIRP